MKTLEIKLMPDLYFMSDENQQALNEALGRVASKLGWSERYGLEGLSILWAKVYSDKIMGGVWFPHLHQITDEEGRSSSVSDNIICDTVHGKIILKPRKRKASNKGNKQALEDDKAETQRKIEKLVERVMNTESPTLIKTYEKSIQDLEKKQAELNEKLKKKAEPQKDFDYSFRTAMEFLSNPYKYWVSGVLEKQRMVLKLAFSEKLPYHLKTGFRTPAIAQPFRLLEGFSGQNYDMVRLARLELARPYGQQILSLQRLPFRHRRVCHIHYRSAAYGNSPECYCVEDHKEFFRKSKP